MYRARIEAKFGGVTHVCNVTVAYRTWKGVDQLWWREYPMACKLISLAEGDKYEISIQWHTHSYKSDGIITSTSVTPNKYNYTIRPTLGPWNLRIMPCFGDRGCVVEYINGVCNDKDLIRMFLQRHPVANTDGKPKNKRCSNNDKVKKTKKTKAITNEPALKRRKQTARTASPATASPATNDQLCEALMSEAPMSETPSSREVLESVRILSDRVTTLQRTTEACLAELRNMQTHIKNLEKGAPSALLSLSRPPSSPKKSGHALDSVRHTVR